MVLALKIMLAQSLCIHLGTWQSKPCTFFHLDWLRVLLMSFAAGLSVSTEDSLLALRDCGEVGALPLVWEPACEASSVEAVVSCWDAERPHSPSSPHTGLRPTLGDLGLSCLVVLQSQALAGAPCTVFSQWSVLRTFPWQPPPVWPGPLVQAGL